MVTPMKRIPAFDILEDLTKELFSYAESIGIPENRRDYVVSSTIALCNKRTSNPANTLQGYKTYIENQWAIEIVTS